MAFFIDTFCVEMWKTFTNFLFLFILFLRHLFLELLIVLPLLASVLFRRLGSRRLLICMYRAKGKKVTVEPSSSSLLLVILQVPKVSSSNLAFRWKYG